MVGDLVVTTQRNVFTWSVTVAIAGFLFGFDTAVIAGADQPVQALWQTSDLYHGLFIMSSALWGTVIGALLGNLPCDRYGRKPTLIAIGVLYLVSALGSALATDPAVFAAFRFIGGLGVGASSIAVPGYIAEIAPAEQRGRLVVLYQFQLVLGILVAYLSNFALSAWFDLGWRAMLGAEALPAAVFLLMVTTVPESPRWLLLKGRDSDARRVIAAISPDRVEHTIADISQSLQSNDERPLFAASMRRPVLLAFLIAFFNQMSGINFVIYFAPRIFGMAGLDANSALLSTAIIGGTNLLFTLLGLLLIDRFGRRLLMLIGSIGYIVSLSAVAAVFATGAGGGLVLIFLIVFIAAHAIGQGAVIWVFIAEIFPNELRSRGQSLGCGTHWVLAALITLVMPLALSRFSAEAIFAFFAGMMLLQLIFVIRWMPETRGRTLEELSADLTAVR